MREQRKPYVRYELSAEIDDKGIAYAAKKAVNTFLKSHGFDGHVTDLDATSNQFRAVLELYDNGKYDFNISALHEHLESSGRLPTRENIRPKIAIKPVSSESSVQLIRESPDAIGYHKTIESLHKQISDKEANLAQSEVTISHLNNAMRERQSTINESKNRIMALEQMIRDSAPKQYDKSCEAVINGYLKNAMDNYMSLSMDIQELVTSRNLPLFESSGNQSNLFFSRYINLAHGTSFQNDAELDKWTHEMATLTSWADTEEAKKLKEMQDHYTVDNELIQIAEQKGTSIELIELLKSKVNENKTKMTSLEAEVTKIKENFDENKKVFSSLEEEKKRYEIFTKIKENSTNRNKAGFVLPVVMEVFETQPGILIYMPYDDPQCELEKYVYKTICQSIPEIMPAGSKPKRLVRDNLSVIVTALDLTPGKVTESLKGLSESLRESKLLKALGATVNLTTISDTQTKPIYYLDSPGNNLKKLGQ